MVEEPRTLSDVELRALSILVDRQQFMRMAGIQFEGKRDLYEIFGYDRLISATQYRDMYARGGIATRIVEAYPKATWRGGVELYEDEDPEKTTPFEAAWQKLEKEHDVWNKLYNADILAGLSTYSVILIGAAGELDTELPMGTPDSLLYLSPFFGGGGPGDQSRSNSTKTVTSDTDVNIQAFDTDAHSRRFGEVLTYQLRRTDLSSPLLQRAVHWSRVIHICEGALDNQVYGVPTLENVWNLLSNLEKVTGGGAESYFQRAKHSMNLNIQKDVAFTPEQLKDLKDKYDEFVHGISNVLPTRGIDVKLLEAAVANFATAVDSLLKQIAGSKGIPLRILTGSEMGSLASEQDSESFNAQVQDRRTRHAGPHVRKLVNRLIKYGYLPTPAQYEVGWPVEEELDEPGKADLALKMTQVNQTQGEDIFSEEEIREKSFDMKPRGDVKAFDKLSETQKAEIAFKLASVNKAMGITVYTDDEIRDMSHGLKPLKDGEKVPIGAPERINVTVPPELGDDGQPIPQAGQPKPVLNKATGAVVPPAKPALAAKIAALEAAIEAKDINEVDRILGISA